MLGSSETLRDDDDAFSTADRKNKIYSKLGGSLQGGYNLPTSRLSALESPPMTPALSGHGSPSELEMKFPFMAGR